MRIHQYNVYAYTYLSLSLSLILHYMSNHGLLTNTLTWNGNRVFKGLLKLENSLLIRVKAKLVTVLLSRCFRGDIRTHVCAILYSQVYLV